MHKPVGGTCARCTEIIAWRKQYRKYKPRTVPGKCSGCGQKNIKAAYHVLCPDCADAREVCAKCMEPLHGFAADDEIARLEAAVAAKRAAAAEAAAEESETEEEGTGSSGDEAEGEHGAAAAAGATARIDSEDDEAA